MFLSHSFTGELLLYTLLGFLSFAFSKNHPPLLLHTLLVAVGIIFSLYRLLKLSLDNEYFNKIRKQLLESKVRELVEHEFQSRINDNSFYTEFDKNKDELKLKFSHSMIHKNNIEVIKANKVGEVYSINIMTFQMQQKIWLVLKFLQLTHQRNNDSAIPT